MERVPCQFENTDTCPVFRVQGECYEDKHHLFYPRSEYRTSTERQFRNLGENAVKICRNLHNTEHHVFEIPDKPDVELMRMAIEEEKNRRKFS